MSRSCPRLGSFYEFFSLAHLTPPLQFIRKSRREQDDESLPTDHLFSFESLQELIYPRNITANTASKTGCRFWFSGALASRWSNIDRLLHTRGLRMCSLGQVVKLSEKLSPVQSLCIHEMIVRAFKDVLGAVIAAVSKRESVPAVIVAALNLMLGVPEKEQSNQSIGVHPLVWRWLEAFLKKEI